MPQEGRLCAMTTSDPKTTLQRYLQTSRDALLWKLEGLSEYDARRPLTKTGTNLLGLVKHVASMEAGYFGDCFGRPYPEKLPWLEEGAEDNADLWATPDQTRQEIIDFYHRVWAHSDASIDALDLDATGEVPWWPEERRVVTLHLILVHVVTETWRHAGHADIVRELVDGAVGHRAAVSNLPENDAAWWASYVEKLEDAARAAR